MFHKDVNNDYIEYFIMDMYKNIMDLTYMEGQGQTYNYTLEIIREEIEMLNSLCKYRTLTNAESEMVDSALEELKDTDLRIRREEDRWKGNLKN